MNSLTDITLEKLIKILPKEVVTSLAESAHKDFLKVKAKNKALEQEVQALKKIIAAANEGYRRCNFCKEGTLQCSECPNILCFNEKCSCLCMCCGEGYFCPKCIKFCENCKMTYCKECMNKGCIVHLV